MTRSRSICDAVAMGSWMTGPSPFANSNDAPMGSSGKRMSANKMAASTPSRRGCSVTSSARSGVLQMSRSVCFSRSLRYSGMYRPACLMNQTGVRSTRSRRQARRKRSFTLGAGPGLGLLVVVGVLEENHVRLASGLADARHVDRRLVLDRADLLARSAPHAKRRIDVRTLQVHRLIAGRRAVRPWLPFSYGRVHLFDPNRLGRRGAELLADDARSLHGPWQTAPLVVEGRADLDRRLALAHLFFLADLLNGPRRTHLPAE